MADQEAVEKTTDFGSNILERSLEYYYNLYSALTDVLYRANISGEYVYYTGTAPPGATDITIIKK
jgi:hypothetical protein